MFSDIRLAAQLIINFLSHSECQVKSGVNVHKMYFFLLLFENVRPSTDHINGF